MGGLVGVVSDVTGDCLPGERRQEGDGESRGFSVSSPQPQGYRREAGGGVGGNQADPPGLYRRGAPSQTGGARIRR